MKMAANSSAEANNCSNFTDIGQEAVSLQENPGVSGIGVDNVETPVKKKVPRRILHFSDGVMEEYSTDEEEEEDQVDNTPKVDPKTLKWLPWFWYYTVVSASKALNVADTCGEKLAWVLGITSPKYQHAIDEFNRMKQEEEEENAREEREKDAMRLRKLQKLDNVEGGGNINMAYSQSTSSNLDTMADTSDKY